MVPVVMDVKVEEELGAVVAEIVTGTGSETIIVQLKRNLLPTFVQSTTESGEARSPLVCCERTMFKNEERLDKRPN